MGRYQVEGPDAAILTKADVVAYLKLASDRALDRLVAAGKFPRGIKVTPQSAPIWQALDVACYLYLAPRMIEDGTEELPADTNS